MNGQGLKDTLSELKGGKAPGPDGIYVDCLKIFGQKYATILLKPLRLLPFQADDKLPETQFTTKEG